MNRVVEDAVFIGSLSLILLQSKSGNAIHICQKKRGRIHEANKPQSLIPARNLSPYPNVGDMELFHRHLPVSQYRQEKVAEGGEVMVLFLVYRSEKS